jgi:glycosyltransferase involved in cell wall biosynthesis
MRVAYVSGDPGVPVFGCKGCSIHVQEVIRALLRRGAEVEVHAARLGGERPPGLENVRVFRLPRLRDAEPAERELVAYGANTHLEAALRSRPAYDMVYERYSLWSAAGMEFARSKGIPGILEVNAPLIEEQAIHRSLVHREMAEQVADRAMGTATLLVAVSKGVAAHLNRIDAARGRVHVVLNGVDHRRFRPGRDRLLPGDPFTVGFVGTLKPWHGLSTLVEAFSLLHRRDPDSRLLVVGDGPERESLMDQLADRGLLASAQFTGAVEPAEVPRWLAAMSVGVAPYPDMEDFYFSPLKIFEYMASGLPIVASRIGQISDLIEHERDGLLCPPGDPKALAGSLERLRSNPGLRGWLGRRAREKAIRNHTWDAVIDTILRLGGPDSPELACAGAS